MSQSNSTTLKLKADDPLVTALRYLLWAIAVDSLVMVGWWIWTSITYSLGRPGNPFGLTWYLHMGMIGSTKVTICALCFISLHRLKLINVSGKFREIPKLIAWIAILEVANVVIGIGFSFSY